MGEELTENQKEIRALRDVIHKWHSGTPLFSLAKTIYDAGYRLSPELTAISDVEIYEAIQPVKERWAMDMAAGRLAAEAQLAHDRSTIEKGGRG